MRPISEKQALARLDELTLSVGDRVQRGYEHRAKSCITCKTPGACCLDAHFVNVRISRLEAVRIRVTLGGLDEAVLDRVYDRIDDAIETYALDAGNDHDQKFACPLFERGVGCLVHDGGKPVPCIMHACYEDASHLPPSDIQDVAEAAIDRLNTATYRQPQPPLPLPIAIRRLLRPRDAA